MRTTATIIICLLISMVFVACEKMNPEQEKILNDLKAEVKEANLEVAGALKTLSDLMIKLNTKEITPEEFKAATAEGQKNLLGAQQNLSNVMTKFDEAKDAGISNTQIAWSVVGGTVGRSLLHGLGTMLGGMGGAGGAVGGLITLLLGGSKSNKVEVVKE